MSHMIGYATILTEPSFTVNMIVSSGLDLEFVGATSDPASLIVFYLVVPTAKYSVFAALIRRW